MSMKVRDTKAWKHTMRFPWGRVLTWLACAVALLGCGAAVAQPARSTSSGQASTGPRPEADAFPLRQAQSERNRALEGSGQAYPSKPIRLLLPFPPGAPSDLVGRTIGQKLGEQMGQNFTPDNRTGAGGTLGLAIAAKAPPDGYTVFVTSPTIALSPLLYSNLPFDPIRDFAPVARLAAIENVMLVHPAVPAKTLKEFVALARSKPGTLNYGSGGPGTTNHLANELLKSLEKLNIVHVPYKGATVATTALMAGEVDEVIVSVASVLSFIRAGKVRPLAVLSEKRASTLPDVPTSKEAGFPNFQMSIWYGMMAPAGTPREIVARLYQETVKAFEDKTLRQHMSNAGMDPWLGSPDELGRLVKSEMARYAKIIQSAGIKKDAL